MPPESLTLDYPVTSDNDAGPSQILTTSSKSSSSSVESLPSLMCGVSLVPRLSAGDFGGLAAVADLVLRPDVEDLEYGNEDVDLCLPEPMSSSELLNERVVAGSVARGFLRRQAGNVAAMKVHF